MSKIIAMSSEDNISQELIKEYNSKNPKIIFITTGSNPDTGNKQWLKDAQNAMKSAGFEIIEYDLENNKCYEDFIIDFKEVDGIHLGGGLPEHLLMWIQRSELDIFLQENKYDLIISGASAGAIVLTHSIKNLTHWEQEYLRLNSYNAIGLIPFEILPHIGSHKEIKNQVRCFEKSCKSAQNGVYLNDNSYIVYENNTFKIVEVNQE
ncbi:MAG: Type 1 glutamine amidotransferase-like domain-containing protein [Candidatus Nanoarchaeia archaeon]